MIDDYFLNSRLNEQVRDRFSLTDLQVLWDAYPPSYWANRVELMVLWQAFSDRACATWLIVNRDTASQFADWVKEAADERRH